MFEINFTATTTVPMNSNRTPSHLLVAIKILFNVFFEKILKIQNSKFIFWKKFLSTKIAK